MINRYLLFVVACCALLFCTFPAFPSFGCMQVKASEIEEQPPDDSSLTPAESTDAEQPEDSPNYPLLIFAVAVIVLLLYFVFGGGK